MRIIITILSALLLISSCKTPMKLTTEEQVKLTDNSLLDVRQKHESSTQTIFSTTKAADENVRIVTEATTVEYDTEKPIDSLTGKPPVKSETIVKQTTESGRVERQAVEEKTNDTVIAELTDNTRRDVVVESKLAHTEKPKYNTVKWVAIILVASAFLVLIFLLRKWLLTFIQK